MEEEKKLEEILAIAQENLLKTQDRIGRLSQEVHILMETYGPKDKEGFALLRNTQAQLLGSRHDLERCRKARKKPYFGRIDFKDQDMPEEESYYIGRAGIAKDGSEPVVIDWRAPAASVYYENALGPCSYMVKNEGIHKIDLKLKRTYEIENDKLKDYYDSDVVAADELLNKYLARSKKAVLGEIIATIQKEQNAIIRKSPRTNLIVQGVAGSGKTTVAMHRISYILYNYQEDFRPEDFYIVGSNRILLNYITGVLPDLDVYGVSQMTMEQLFIRLLYEDWDPDVFEVRPGDQKEDTFCLKGSSEWFRDLERFCEDYERRTIPAGDVRLEKDETLLMEGSAVIRYLEGNPGMSMQGKIQMLNASLLSKLENHLAGKYVSYTPEEKKEFCRQCRKYFGKKDWKGSVFELYREFLLSQAEKGKKVFFLEKSFDVYDLAALAYLYKRIKETDPIREASHVIIDEAQDFGMMAYQTLSYCLRGCTYTIMGDVSQNIHFGSGLNDWEELKALILTGDYDSFETLKKSYRNTVEISEFAAEILRHGSFPVYPCEPISRHGDPVREEVCNEEKEMLQKTVQILGKWQEKGRETIAVICRDGREAEAVGQEIRKVIPGVKSSLDTLEFGNGIMVLPVEYTKGLEFDAVLLYNPSGKNYPAEDAYVKLLYVAATRALHELTVVCGRDLTDLIGKPADRQKDMASLENQKEEEMKKRRAALFENRPERSDRQQRILDAIQGEKEREQRKYLGPKPVAVSRPGMAEQEKAGKQEREKPAGLDAFGEIPEESLLRPAGHSRIDQSVRMVKKTKEALYLFSRYGTLRLTPLSDQVIRVQFQRGQTGRFETGCWEYTPQKPVQWRAREGKNLAEVSTACLTVRADKKTGALQFFDQKGKLLLAEKPEMPRQVEPASLKTWSHFAWPKGEKIFARGILANDRMYMNQKARYISFGSRNPRMPHLFSEAGYGLGIGNEYNVICSRIPSFGNYICTEGRAEIDYYFFLGKDLLTSCL